MQADLNVILPEIVISLYAMAALLCAAYTGKDKMAGREKRLRSQASMEPPTAGGVAGRQR